MASGACRAHHGDGASRDGGARRVDTFLDALAGSHLVSSGVDGEGVGVNTYMYCLAYLEG